MKMGIWKNSVTTFFSVLNRLILYLKNAFQITKLVVSSACLELVAKNQSLGKRNKEL